MSVNHLLKQNLTLGEEFIQLGTTGRLDEVENARLPFAKRSAEECSRIRVIAGHEVTIRTEEVIAEKIARRITFLRKPASHIVSAFNYETSHTSNKKWDDTASFETWYAHQERDQITKFLAKRVIPSRLQVALAQGQRFVRYPLKLGAGSGVFDLVKKALTEFWFVGCTEYLDRDFPQLIARMGLTGNLEKRNAAGKNFARRLQVTPELESRLERENPFDTQLYNYWHDRLDESRARIAGN